MKFERFLAQRLQAAGYRLGKRAAQGLMDGASALLTRESESRAAIRAEAEASAKAPCEVPIFEAILTGSAPLPAMIRAAQAGHPRLLRIWAMDAVYLHLDGWDEPEVVAAIVLLAPKPEIDLDELYAAAAQGSVFLQAMECLIRCRAWDVVRELTGLVAAPARAMRLAIRIVEAVQGTNAQIRNARTRMERARRLEDKREWLVVVGILVGAAILSALLSISLTS